MYADKKKKKYTRNDSFFYPVGKEIEWVRFLFGVLRNEAFIFS